MAVTGVKWYAFPLHVRKEEDLEHFFPKQMIWEKREASLLVLSTIREINEIRAIIVGEYNLYNNNTHILR